MKIYQKVPELAARTKKDKLYSCLQLDATGCLQMGLEDRWERFQAYKLQ